MFTVLLLVLKGAKGKEEIEFDYIITNRAVSSVELGLFSYFLCKRPHTPAG